jgi:hypothetical protein
METQRPLTILGTDPEILERAMFKNHCAQCPEACRIDEGERLRSSEKLIPVRPVCPDKKYIKCPSKQKVGTTPRVYRWNPTHEALCPNEDGELLCPEVREYYYHKEYDRGVKEDSLSLYEKYEGNLDNESGINNALDLKVFHNRHKQVYVADSESDEHLIHQMNKDGSDILAHFESDDETRLFQAYYAGKRTTPKWLDAMEIARGRRDDFVESFKAAKENLIKVVITAQIGGRQITNGRERRKWELTDKQINLFMLRYVRGWAPSKIARRTGTTRQNVSKEIGKAKKKIAHLHGWEPSKPLDMNRLRGAGYQVIYLPDKEEPPEYSEKLVTRQWRLTPKSTSQEVLKTFLQPEREVLLPLLIAFRELCRDLSYPSKARHPRTKYAIKEARSEFAQALPPKDHQALWSHCFKRPLPGKCCHTVSVKESPPLSAGASHRMYKPPPLPVYGDGEANYRPTHYGTCPHTPGSEACLSCAPSQYYEQSIPEGPDDKRYEGLGRDYSPFSYFSSWSPRCNETWNPTKIIATPEMRPRVILLRKLLKIFLLSQKK